MFKLCQLMHDKDLPEANDCFWPVAACRHRLQSAKNGRLELAANIPRRALKLSQELIGN